MSKTMINDLTQGSVGRQLLKFAFPFMLSNALQTVYNLVDMIIVGQFVGATGLSGVSTGGQLTWLLCCLAIGFTAGGQIIISQQVGAGNHQALNRTIGTIFTVVGCFAILFSVLGIALHGPLLRLLNTPAEAMEEAKSYVIICSSGMFFVYGYNTVSAILQGMGDSKRPFIFIAIAAILNVVLDLIFVGPLGMASAGAALATTLSQAVSFLIALVYLYRNKEAFGFDFKLKSFIPDRQIFSSLVKLGLPLTVQSSAISISMMYVAAGINSYGLMFSSVYGIGSKLQSLMFIITNSISTASANMFGQNLGAGKPDRVKKIYWYGILICMSFFVVVTVVCLALPEPIFRMFTQDPEVLTYAAPFMVTLVVMFSGFASMTPGIALVNGIGNGSLSLIIALLDGVLVRIGLCILLSGPMGMGVWGYFWGNALAGYVSTIMGSFYYLSGMWKRRKLVVN